MEDDEKDLPQNSQQSAQVDSAGFLAALTTEHFAIQGSRASGTGEATSRASLYIATLSSSLVATGFASGTPYVSLFLGVAIPLVLLLGHVTFLRLVFLTREDLRHTRDVEVIRGYYRSLSPDAGIYFRGVSIDDVTSMVEAQGARHNIWLLLSSAGSMIAILNATVLGAGVTVLVSTLIGGFQFWTAGVGAVGAVLLAVATIRYEHREANNALTA